MNEKTKDQQNAEDSFRWEIQKAEAATKGLPLVRTDEAPPRRTQEIPSAPGLPF